MVVNYPPDLSKIEKLLQKILSTTEEKREKRVKERYTQLTGLIQNGEMVNKDKEFRARQWVTEQEKKEQEEKSKRKWWEKTWVQIIVLIGAITGIIGLLIIVF